MSEISIYEWISRIAIFQGSFNDMKDLEDILNVVAAIICVICGGLASGLTMGLMSFDNTKLLIKTMTGTEEEVRAAKAIIPIISNHHLLLVTLLLFNAISMEALPIFLDDLVPGYVAVLISVTLVLIFGEVNNIVALRLFVFVLTCNITVPVSCPSR